MHLKKHPYPCRHKSIHLKVVWTTSESHSNMKHKNGHSSSHRASQKTPTVPIDRKLFALSHGHVWPCVAMHCQAWPDMARHGRTWPYMAIYGHVWPCMAIHGHTWPYMAMHGHIWPSCPFPLKWRFRSNWPFQSKRPDRRNRFRTSARLRRYSAQPHIHVTRPPYAVVLSSVF